MTSENTAEPVGCRLLCEFEDGDAAAPEAAAGEPVPTQLIAAFQDTGEREPAVRLPLRDFTVLTADDRTITVRGHSLECGPDGTRQVVVYEAGQRVCVGLFDAARILGIFQGSARAPA